MKQLKKLSTLATCYALMSCSQMPTQSSSVEIVGTNEAFAREAIYFLLTDRFVDGDPSNNHEDQGGEFPTFDIPLKHPNGEEGNIGYLGGDFQGILNNADYIKDLGFTAIWLSPIVDNPDQHFNGGYKVGEHMFSDNKKTGYHGYWGVNFFEVDEHWVSEELSFSELTSTLKEKYQIKTVLDIVGNHGSPSYMMNPEQPLFGEIYDENGTLIADHQNIFPKDLNSSNPLHQFFHKTEDIAQLSNIDEDNPAVLDYFVRAYLKWIDEGADAFRIDTIRHMPHHFWKKFSDAIRAKHPDFYMFGESFEFDAKKVAQHTLPENGRISVLDFPGREKMQAVFENDAPMTELLDYLHLTDGIYDNPYDLVIFYDNHDMSRLNATDNNFVNVNNWLFTSRGIPAVYYGSETGFMRGKKEHYGNRNFFGQARVEQAKSHPIAQSMKKIANVRKNSIALQKGVQLNLDFGENHASFLRIYQKDNVSQTALVLLNKSDEPMNITLDKHLQAGNWTDVLSGEEVLISQGVNSFDVSANGVRVLVSNHSIGDKELLMQLCELPQALGCEM